MAERRSSACHYIPDNVQAPMRNRLRLLRVSRGMGRANLKTVGDGTLQYAELKDISKMRFGDLYGMAVEYGLGFGEFLDYIIGDNDHEVTDEARRMQRMSVFFRSLSDDLQELACDLVQKLVTYHVDNKSLRSIERAPGVRREARSIVRDAIENQGGSYS